MTKLLEQAIAKAQALPPEDQDALALAMLSLTEGDASGYPIDDATRAAILEGLKDARLRAGHCLNHVKAATDVERTARVSQRHRLFRSETVAIRRRVVIDIAAGGLID